jgi:hypothetical protein
MLDVEGLTLTPADRDLLREPLRLTLPPASWTVVQLAVA